MLQCISKNFQRTFHRSHVTLKPGGYENIEYDKVELDKSLSYNINKLLYYILDFNVFYFR